MRVYFMCGSITNVHKILFKSETNFKRISTYFFEHIMFRTFLTKKKLPYRLEKNPAVSSTRDNCNKDSWAT